MTDELRFYLESTTDLDPTLEQAYEDAHEFGLPVPDIVTGRLLTTLTAATQAQAAIAVTPAANVVGLYLLAGLGTNGILTCVAPEPEHQRFAAGVSVRGLFAESHPVSTIPAVRCHG